MPKKGPDPRIRGSERPITLSYPGISDGTDSPEIHCRHKSRRYVMPLLDISPGGCMAACPKWPAEEGDEISVKLPGLDTRLGRIVWIEDGRTGIAFEELLHELTFAQLQGMIPA